MIHSTTTHQETYSSIPGVDAPKLGMWLFLVTEVMLFSSFIGALLHAFNNSPAGANDVLNIPITAGNTFVLIVSSFTVVMALQSALEDNQRRVRLYLLATLLLGATFLGVQIFEYRELLHEGFTPSTNLFSGAFFTTTGFHGFHVFIGLVLILWLLPQAFKGRFHSGNFMRLEVFGLYWHFVDIVWIVLFTIIYLL
jgi:cytochrome c oxidase subunit 3/cytochrome o ubiquinol oxidase subunit 3